MMTIKKHLICSGIVISAISLSLMCFTCRKRTESPVIARVGQSVLTLDDLYERIPPEYNDRITREQKINYVKQWIDTEILFQEAMRLKIHKEPEISGRLLQMKKDLLSSEMISRYAFSPMKYPVSEDAVRKYYETNIGNFVRESDVVKYMEIVLDNEKTGWEVHKMITPENFIDIAIRFSKAPVQDSRAIPYISVKALPEKIAAVIPTIKIGGTTGPIEINGRYHIFRIFDKQSAGTTCALDEVREEIVGTLSTETQKKHMEDLISEIRLKTDYEFNVDVIPSADEADQNDPGQL